MTRIYRSGVRGAVYEAMERLHAAGLIDHDSMRSFDDLCLVAGGHDDARRSLAKFATQPKSGLAGKPGFAGLDRSKN